MKPRTDFKCFELKGKAHINTSEQSLLANNLIAHWDNVYANSAVTRLGWYENDPDPSMHLIKLCKLDKKASILNVGAGATTLVDALIKDGYENIIANDLSSNALDKLKTRLGSDSGKVTWILDDLTHPNELADVGAIDLWHDRAVLHFFMEKEEQDTYFDLLRQLVKKDGFVIIAAFHLDGAAKCSGLPVHRYDEHALHARIGNDFELLSSFNHTYVMPSGDLRKYVYTLFMRSK